MTWIKAQNSDLYTISFLLVIWTIVKTKNIFRFSLPSFFRQENNNNNNKFNAIDQITSDADDKISEQLV